MSDFGKDAWIPQGSEALFSRNMRNNTCSLVGGLIGFDYSSQGGRRNTDPKLIWGMSVTMIQVTTTILTQGEEPSAGKPHARICEGESGMVELLDHPRGMANTTLLEKIVLFVIFLLVPFGLTLSFLDLDFFDNHYTRKDGFVEWLTVLALFSGALVCLGRVIRLRSQKALSFSYPLLYWDCCFYFLPAKRSHGANVSFKSPARISFIKTTPKAKRISTTLSLGTFGSISSYLVKFLRPLCCFIFWYYPFFIENFRPFSSW